MDFNKLEQIINVTNQQNQLQAVNQQSNLEKFIQLLKQQIRQKSKERFAKVVFDKTENGTGMIFIKFANCPWKEANDEMLNNSDRNFVIAIDGFDSEGQFEEESSFNVNMIRHQDKTNSLKKLRAKSFYNLVDAGSYVTKYFNMLEDIGADSPLNMSGATNSTEGGPDFSVGSISFANAPRMDGGQPQRRAVFKKKERKKK